MITEQSGNVVVAFAMFIVIISGVHCWMAETKLAKLAWTIPIIVSVAALVGMDIYLGHF